MKNLIFATLVLGASLLPLAAMAEDVKVVEFSVANSAELGKAVATISELSGQPALGVMGAALLAKPEFKEAFTPIGGKKRVLVCDAEQLDNLPDSNLRYLDEEGEAANLEEGCLVQLSWPQFSKMPFNDPMTHHAELPEIERADVGLWVTKAGVDLRFSLEFGKDDAEALNDLIPMGADPLPKIPDDSVFSFACSSNAKYAEQVAMLVSMLKSSNPDMGFLDSSVEDGFVALQLDIATMPNDEDKARKILINLAELNAAKLLPEVVKLDAPRLQGASVTLKGIDCGVGARQGAELFPGEDVSQCAGLIKISPCRLIKGFLTSPLIKHNLSAGDAEALDQYLALLPSFDGADMGIKFWHDNSRLNITVRANPAELKSLAALVAPLFLGMADDTQNIPSLLSHIIKAIRKGDDNVKKPQDTERPDTQIEINFAKPNSAEGKILDFDSFSCVKVTDKDGNLVKRLYKLYKGNAKNRKLVREICVTPTDEDKAFDAKWLVDIKPVSDKTDLEMMTCRTLARHILKGLDDTACDAALKQVLIKHFIEEDVQKKYFRPYVGRKGISAAILQVLTARPPEIKVIVTDTETPEDK